MTQERFEWLEIPDEPTKPNLKKDKAPEAVVGKRCPACGWLDEETAMRCFRCGYRYNLDYDMAGRIAELGVTLPPRVLETEQNLENFFRIHGRAERQRYLFEVAASCGIGHYSGTQPIGMVKLKVFTT